MKRVMRLTALVLIVALCAASLSLSAGAISFDNDVTTYSDSILMVNLDTNMVVYSKDPDVQRYPAGLTKIMTYIVAAEYFDDFNTRIKIKQSIIDGLIANGMSCSGLDWHVGESMTVLDILYALMLPIGHDAAMVLADYIGEGKESAFVEMMNQKAAELGCTGTHFMNATGVHHKNHYTTARDLYRITKYALGLPMFSKICGTKDYLMEGDDYPLVTNNYMIDRYRAEKEEYFYEYATGVKTGTTDEAGRCLVATARDDDKGFSYICICLHAPYDYDNDVYEQYCMLEAKDLFKWALNNLTFVTPVTKDTPVCEQKVDHAWDVDSILLAPDADLNVILPKGYSQADIKIVPDHTETVSAPIEKGDLITTATVYYQDRALTKVNLLAQESVEVSPVLYVTESVSGVLVSEWFLLAVAVIVVLFVIYVIVSSSYAKKRSGSKARASRRDKRR